MTSAVSGATATLAASDAAARLHSVGDSDGARPSSIACAKAGSQGASRPRATATWRHTSDSRSRRRRVHADSTASDLKTRRLWSSPYAAHRAASRAARSRRRAARRRDGSEPVDGAEIQSRARSRRDAIARASGPSAMPRPMGSSVTSAMRARTPGLASPLPGPRAMRLATATKVAASAARRRARTRRPRSLCSGPAGSAEASS